MGKHSVEVPGGMEPGYSNKRAVRGPAGTRPAPEPATTATHRETAAPNPGTDAASTSTSTATGAAAPKRTPRKRKVGKHKS